MRLLAMRRMGSLRASGANAPRNQAMRIFVWIAAIMGFSAIVIPARAHSPAADTVLELRDVLKHAGDNPSERQHRLASAVDAVTDLADMQRAIALLEWRDEDPDPAIAAIDNQSRRALAQKYETLLRDHLRGPAAEER